MLDRGIRKADLAVKDTHLDKMGFVPLVVEVKRDSIVVRASRYRGQIRISLRYHWRDEKGGGLRPTKRGIEVPIDVVKEVALMLHRVIDQVEELLPITLDEPADRIE